MDAPHAEADSEGLHSESESQLETAACHWQCSAKPSVWKPLKSDVYRCLCVGKLQNNPTK